MRVSELVAQLQVMPRDAEVGIIYDGSYRLDADVCYVARSGVVLLCGSGEVVYNTVDRPLDAPVDDVDPYWRTP